MTALRTRSILAALPVLGVLASASAAEPAPEVRVSSCGVPAAAASGTVSRWLAPIEALGVKVSVAPEREDCLGLDRATRSKLAPADVSVQTWQTEAPATSTSEPKPSPIIRTRVSFETTDGLKISISGRTFSAAIASRSLDFPTRVAEQRPAPQKDALPPEALFVQGIVALAAFERRATTAKEPAALAAAAQVREWALAALEGADSRDVELYDPETSAVIKQLRAILILQGACSVDTAAGLLRAAARLIPHDSEARAAAAIGRLMESSAPAACPATTERELLESLALNRWSSNRIDDLGRFYELSVNATSAPDDDSQAVHGDVAAERLDKVWQARAPVAPHVLELAVSAGLAKSAGTDADFLRTVTPAVRLEATLGRDSPGFGFRVAATLPWTRELTLGSGTVSWTRMVFAAGGRYRNRIHRFYMEGGAEVLLAPALAAGHGFDTNYRAVGLDAGGALETRLGLRFGRFSVWAGASGSFFVANKIPGWPDLTIRATGVSETNVLPTVDLAALVGVSQMFWR